MTVHLRSALLTFALVAIIGGLALLEHGSPPTDYTLATWKWDYSLGLIRRGLLGEVVRGLGLVPTPLGVFRGAVAIFGACVALYGALAAVVVYRRPAVSTMAVALSGVALAPGLPSLVVALGRLDQAGTAIFLLCSIMICAARSEFVALPVGVMSAAAVLIHEGFAVEYLPFLLALMTVMAVARGLAWLPMAFVACFLPVVVLGNVMLAKPPVSQAEWMPYWIVRPPFIAPTSDVVMNAFKIHYLSLGDNFRWALGFAMQHHFSVLIAAAVAAVAAFTAWALCWPAIARSPRRLAWAAVLLACFAPLVMFGIGIDFLRWPSYAVQNLCVGALAYLWIESPAVPAWDALTAVRVRYAAVALTLAFLASPLSAGEFWPMTGDYTECVYAAVFSRGSVAGYCNKRPSGTEYR